MTKVVFGPINEKCPSIQIHLTSSKGNFFTEDKVYYPPLLLVVLPFNKYHLKFEKDLGIHLDEELKFKHHINEKINKANKGIGIIRKLNNILPRSALLTIYRSFIRPHLDYGDVIYDQPENESFSSKIVSVQ